MPITVLSVACAANAGYALPLAVMLNSLGSHLGSEVSVEAHIVDDGLTPDDRERVAASLDTRFRLEWKQPAILPEGLPTWGRMAVTTYQKLMVGEWLPSSLNYALWLDCDLLIVTDITRLWRSALTTNLVLAAQDQRVPLVSSKFGVAAHRELGISSRAKYFNAGVMMIDLDRWRRQEVSRRALQYLERFGKSVYFWDQEALNAVVAGEWGELDSRWNWHPALDRLTRPTFAPETTNGVGGERPDPWIVHFSGNLKPWLHFGAGRYWDLYQRHLDRTPWAGLRPEHHWKARFMAWYEMSRLRRYLYPAEQWGTEFMRDVTAEYHRPE